MSRLLIRSLLLLSLAAPLADAARREVNAIAAIVNGRVITRSEVDEAVKHTREMITITVPPGPERDRQLRTLEEDAINSLIERELILAEFDKLGGVLKDEIIEEDISKIINGERFKGDRDAFLAELRRTGMTLKRFKDLRRKIVTVEMMRSRETGGIKIVTPQQLQAAYEKHGDRFRGPGAVRLRTLMIPRVTADEGVTVDDQRELANTIRRRVLAGEDFAQMARTYSQDSAAADGGDRGTVTLESGDLRKDLVMAGLALKTGEVSIVLEDAVAFWLLKSENTKPGVKKPLSDPEVRDTCEKLALLDMRKEAHDRWVAKLMRTASIRRFDGDQVTSVTPPKSEPLPSAPRTAPAPTPPAPGSEAVEASPPAPEPEKRRVIDRLRIFRRD